MGNDGVKGRLGALHREVEGKRESVGGGGVARVYSYVAVADTAVLLPNWAVTGCRADEGLFIEGWGEESGGKTAGVEEFKFSSLIFL